MTQMLLPIKPQYVREIITEKKKFEYRKFRCRDDIDTIVIYATAPVKKAIGGAHLIDIIEDDVESVWSKTKDFGGISKENYDAYYKKHKKAIAYQLGDITLYDKPKSLEDLGLNYTPQSFAYLQTMLQS